MNRGTQAIIGATLLLLGGAFILWGVLDDEATVRTVEEVLADPAGHQGGAYTVMGVPHANGTATSHHRWSTTDGIAVVSQLDVTVTQDGPTETSFWSLTNTTRALGSGHIISNETATWNVTGPHRVFRVENFHTADAPMQSLWATYHGTLREALLPKPSQFTGHVDLSAGVPVLSVSEVTIGCSSKFLPEEYQDDGDESSGADAAAAAA